MEGLQACESQENVDSAALEELWKVIQNVIELHHFSGREET